MKANLIVVGGGFAGLCAAQAFAQRGLQVVVLEAHQTHDPRFRGELIHPRGVRDLHNLGLLSSLREAGGVWVTGFAATLQNGVDAALLRYDDDKGPGLGIDHHVMVQTLRREVSKNANVQLVKGQRVDRLLFDGDRVVGVSTAQGQTYQADWTFAADGRQSFVRKALGIDPKIELLSYSFAPSVEGPYLPYADHGHVFLGADGPILAYPYAENRIRFVIDIPLGAAKGRDEIRKYIQENHAPHVPQPLRAALLETLQHQPLEGCANQSITTVRCAAKGAALLGDAAGCSHPLTAAGMTIGVNDVCELARVFDEEGQTDEALLEYQHRRYKFVRARELFTEALYEVFRGHSQGALGMRQGVFRYWKGSDRARAASMAILSCEESRPSKFVSEYARVMGLSTLDILRHAKGFSPRISATSAMLSTSLARLETTFGRTLSFMFRQRRLGLQAVKIEEKASQREEVTV